MLTFLVKMSALHHYPLSSQNRNTNESTHHINRRHHYVRNMANDGLVELEFVYSRDNDVSFNINAVNFQNEIPE